MLNVVETMHPCRSVSALLLITSGGIFPRGSDAEFKREEVDSDGSWMGIFGNYVAYCPATVCAS